VGYLLGRSFKKIANSLAFHNMPCHNTRKTKEVIHQLKSEHPSLPRARSKLCFQLVNPHFTRELETTSLVSTLIGEERRGERTCAQPNNLREMPQCIWRAKP
jgi:hypothetical protein